MKNTNTNAAADKLTAELEKIAKMTADERNAAAKTDEKNELTAAIYSAIGAKNDELKTAADNAAAAAKTAADNAAAAILTAAAAADNAAAAAKMYAIAAIHNVNAAAEYGIISDNADNADNAAAIGAKMDMFGEYSALTAELTAAADNAAAAAKTAADNAAAAAKTAAENRAAIVKKYDELKTAAAANTGAIADALTAAANAAAAELSAFDNAAKTAADNAERDKLTAAITAIFGICAADKPNATPKTERKPNAAASDKYTYVDAVVDAVTDNWLTAGGVADNAEKIGKLAQIKTNPRWTGAFANALKTAADSGLIDRRDNGKCNEYRRKIA